MGIRRPSSTRYLFSALTGEALGAPRTCTSWWHTDNKMNGLCSGDPRQRKGQTGNEGGNHGRYVVLFVSKVNINDHRKTWGLASKAKRQIKPEVFVGCLTQLHMAAMAHKYMDVTGKTAEPEELGNSKYKEYSRSLLGTIFFI